MEISKCRDCGQAILWLVHETTGRLAPINAEPDPKGNIIILPTGFYAVRATDDSRWDYWGGSRHTNHFATCPAAKKRRKAKVQE